MATTKPAFIGLLNIINPTEDKVVEFLILAVIRLANKENIITNQKRAFVDPFIDLHSPRPEQTGKREVGSLGIWDYKKCICTDFKK